MLERLGLGYEVMKSSARTSSTSSNPAWAARDLWPDAHRRADRGGFRRTGGDVGPAGARDAGGWGYSYLDWMGAYSYALAMLGASIIASAPARASGSMRRSASAALPDGARSSTGRPTGGWRRYGNRSPYKPAAPHGAYRCAGEDRWIAIACFTDEEWQALAQFAGHANGSPTAAFDARNPTGAPGRARRRVELDLDPGRHDCMKLQTAGVPAGVCQTAEDRCRLRSAAPPPGMADRSHGHQNRHLAGRRVPMKLSTTPALSAARSIAARPATARTTCTSDELLGRSSSDVDRLADEGLI